MQRALGIFLGFHTVPATEVKVLRTLQSYRIITVPWFRNLIFLSCQVQFLNQINNERNVKTLQVILMKQIILKSYRDFGRLSCRYNHLLWVIGAFQVLCRTWLCASVQILSHGHLHMGNATVIYSNFQHPFAFWILQSSSMSCSRLTPRSTQTL